MLLLDLLAWTFVSLQLAHACKEIYYQVMTCPELVPTARKERKGKIMVTQKHQIGTPFLVHLRKNLGAWPSRARL
jgi:hypothetical protein